MLRNSLPKSIKSWIAKSIAYVRYLHFHGQWLLHAICQKTCNGGLEVRMTTLLLVEMLIKP